MNEKDVPTYPITDWIPTHATVDQEKYPQPGDPNPGVRLGVVSTGGGKTKWITAKTAKTARFRLGNDPNVLIPRFGWVRDGLLWAMVAQPRAGPDGSLLRRCRTAASRSS